MAKADGKQAAVRCIQLELDLAKATRRCTWLESRLSGHIAAASATEKRVNDWRAKIGADIAHIKSQQSKPDQCKAIDRCVNLDNKLVNVTRLIDVVDSANARQYQRLQQDMMCMDQVVRDTVRTVTARTPHSAVTSIAVERPWYHSIWFYVSRAVCAVGSALDWIFNLPWPPSSVTAVFVFVLCYCVWLWRTFSQELLCIRWAVVRCTAPLLEMVKSAL